MKIRLQKSSKGIALIIVMLVILVLAALAGGFAYTMKVETTLARNANYETEFEWLGRAGVELARYVIAEQAKIPGEGNYESLNQKWAGGPGGVGSSNSPLAEIYLENNQLGSGTFSVKITDLERKFNVNVALQSNGDALKHIMVNIMGVEGPLADSISDSILDWIDKDDDNRLSGAESDYYLGLDPPYVAKNGPIDDISELLMVKGVFENSEIYWGSAAADHSPSAFQTRSIRPFDDPRRLSYPIGLVDVLTTFSSGKININTASATTLQLIPGIDEGIAAGIIQLRSGPDGADGTEDDIPFQSTRELRSVPGMESAIEVRNIEQYCGVRSYAFEVQVDVELNGITRQYIAIIRRATGPNDFVILKFYWKSPDQPHQRQASSDW